MQFVASSGPVRDLFGFLSGIVRDLLGFIRDPFGVRSGSVRNLFGVHTPGSFRDPFGVCSGSVWDPFPELTTVIINYMRLMLIFWHTFRSKIYGTLCILYRTYTAGKAPPISKIQCSTGCFQSVWSVILVSQSDESLR